MAHNFFRPPKVGGLPYAGDLYRRPLSRCKRLRSCRYFSKRGPPTAVSQSLGGSAQLRPFHASKHIRSSNNNNRNSAAKENAFRHFARDTQRASEEHDIFTISEEVQQALSEARAVVALETTIYTHGFPYPDNVALAKDLESIVYKNGAVPATIGIVNGVARVGLNTVRVDYPRVVFRETGDYESVSKRYPLYSRHGTFLNGLDSTDHSSASFGHYCLYLSVPGSCRQEN